MHFTKITNPNTNKSYSIFSKKGTQLLKKYITFFFKGGGKCSLCGASGTTKSTCPLNP